MNGIIYGIIENKNDTCTFLVATECTVSYQICWISLLRILLRVHYILSILHDCTLKALTLSKMSAQVEDYLHCFNFEEQNEFATHVHHLSNF